MSLKTKLALAVAILLWSSAYAAIRAGLQEYSPEGLALLRYLIASGCMGLVYFRLPARTKMTKRDIVALLGVGAVGIGFYNITLNYGEMFISSGMASFIISQSPIVTAIIAIIFLGEQITLLSVLGFLVSLLGIAFIAMGELGEFKWTTSLACILLATLAGGCYSILQKPFLKKYHAIEATTYVIWGGTLFLLYYLPELQHDVMHASLKTTLTVAYLGIFPAAIGYLAWSYALSEIPASRAASFLYFSPFISLLLGWVWLAEVPVMLSVVGGLLAIMGVWIVNHSYKRKEAMIES